MDEVLIKHFGILVPELEDQFGQLARSSVDVGVWLVGLSTGLVALLLSTTSVREVLPSWTYQTGLVLFSAVVFSGVVQRVLFHVAERMRWPISLRFRGALIGLTEETVLAREIQDYWTVEDIVERLRADFGVDYSYLLEYAVPVEKAREAYNGQLELHRQFEEEGLQFLARVMTAHYGQPKESEENYFGRGNDPDFEQTRSEARRVNWVFFAAEVAYIVVAASFVVGIALLVIGAVGVG